MEHVVTGPAFASNELGAGLGILSERRLVRAALPHARGAHRRCIEVVHERRLVAVGAPTGARSVLSWHAGILGSPSW